MHQAPPVCPTARPKLPKNRTAQAKIHGRILPVVGSQDGRFVFGQLAGEAGTAARRCRE